MVHFPKEKLWVNFFSRKKRANRGGGGVSDGGLSKEHNISRFFFSAPFPDMALFLNAIGSLTHTEDLI